MDQNKPSSMSSWKCRFNPLQLERKRLSDRLNQRRTRKQTKEYVAELEKRIQILTRGEHATLINQLIKENNDLRASLSRHRANTEAVTSRAKECLEGGESCPSDELFPSQNAQHDHSRFDQSLGQLGQSVGEVDEATGFDFISPSPCLVLQSADQALHGSSTVTTSIIFQAASLVLPSWFGQTALPLTQRQWIQSILMWKMVNSHASNCYFLHSHFNLETGPTSLTIEETQKTISMSSFDFQLLKCLIRGSGLPQTKIPSHIAQTQCFMDTNEEQRRAILLCAFKLVSPWRKYYKSAVEFGFVFWAIYRYFTFLTFPTEENLKATPGWILPTPSQMLREHPGYIDFLIWPHLRERLTLTSGQYDEEGLVLQLIMNFEILIEARTDLENGFPLRLAPEDQKLQLKPQFSTIFKKMGGFSTNPEFGVKYPELMPYVFPSGAAIVPLQSESGRSSQVFTWLDLEPPPRHTAADTVSIQETRDLEFLRDHTTTEPAECSWVSDPVENSSFRDYACEAPGSDISSPKDLSGIYELPSECSSVLQDVTPAAIGRAYEEFCDAFAPFSPFTSVNYEDLF